MKLGGYDTIDIPPGCNDGTLCGHYQPADVPEPFSDTVKLLSAVIRYQTSSFAVTSATSYWKRNETQTQDASEVVQNVAGTPYVGIPYTEYDHSEQFSEELRISSNGDGRLQWLGGLFFSNFHYQLSQYSANNLFIDPIDNPQGVLVDLNVPYDTKQYAAFAEASYKITPAWKFTVGVRGFRYTSEASFYNSGLFSPNGPASPYSATVNTSDHGTTPKFNLAYIPNPDLTVYASASKGFRPGGVSQPFPTSGPASCQPALDAIGFKGNTTSFAPDSLWNYELGEKARILNGKVSIHSDVYYIRWSDIQQQIPLDCGYLLVANAGDARSYGADLEVQARVTPGTTLNINGAYTNAAIDRPASFSGVTPGQPLYNIPKYSAGVSLDYQHPFHSDLSFIGRISETVVGPQWDIAYAPQQLASYALTDARFGLSVRQWSATLFVQNATNKMAIQTINNTFFVENMPALTRATVNQPRTIGLKFDWRLH
jgi:outer membrane receptor protein involved in Fe transport